MKQASPIINHKANSSNIPTLPPNFLISFQYWPDANTVIRLLSIEIDDHQSPQPIQSSTLILSSNMTIVYPSSRTYFVPWTNITTTTPHRITLLIANGEFSLCVDNLYQLPLWNTHIWKHNVSRADVRISFTEHLPKLSQSVSVTVKRT